MWLEMNWSTPVLNYKFVKSEVRCSVTGPVTGPVTGDHHSMTQPAPRLLDWGDQSVSSSAPAAASEPPPAGQAGGKGLK